MKDKIPTIEKKKRKQCLGATMVETVVSLVLLATFIAGASKVVMAHRQLADKSRAHYTAINIAKNQIEQVRNMRRADYAQIFAMMENGVEVDAEGKLDNINGKFRRTTTISKDTTNDFRLEIEVEVEIRNPKTLSFDGESETLKSYMAHLL